MIGTSVSHYLILEKLGSGGMGEVYAAEDTHLARRVAVKFPSVEENDREGLNRFQIEARAASRLDHPNIAHIYDYGEAPDGRPFLVMELVKGTTLRQVLKSGPLPPTRAVGVVEGVLRALYEAHTNGLIHRDVKPANVMLAETGEVKVLDFGLAKEIVELPSGNLSEAATVPAGLTRPGVAPGTPEYMSPEQARGLLLDTRSDLFSAGLVLYECLTGRQAFPGGKGQEVLHHLIHSDPPPPSACVKTIPAILDRITLKALSKDPSQRYQSAGEMLRDLESAGSSLTAPAVWAVSVRLRRRTIGILCVFVPVLAAWLLWYGRSPQPAPEALTWYNRGVAALRDGTYYRAERALEEAVKTAPDFALAHARLAEAAGELDDFDRANREMLAALDARSGKAPAGLPALYVDAVRRTLLWDYAGAVRVYTELARRVPAADKSAAMVDLGRAQEKNGQASSAEDAYREAIRLDLQNAAAHLRAAVLLGRRQKPEAGDEFSRAESLYKSMSNTEGQAEVLYQRGLHDSLDLRTLDRARADLEESIRLARAISTPFQEIAATLQLSAVIYQGGKPADGEQLAASAVERARREDMWYLAARGLIDLGNAQSLQGNLVKGEANLQEALSLSRRFRMPRNEARALTTLASLHQRKGEPELALQEILHALEFYRRANFRREILSCDVVIGRVNRDLGKAAEALSAFQEQLSLAKSLNDEQQSALAEQGIASVLVQQERFPEALPHYQASRESAAKVNYRDAVVRGLTGIANVLWRLGQAGEATAALDEAEALTAQMGNPASLRASIVQRRAYLALSLALNREAAGLARQAAEMDKSDVKGRASMMCLEGLALARSGLPRQGKSPCAEGLAALVEAKQADSITECRLAMAEVLIGNGELSPALDQIRQAREALESLGRQESTWRAWALASRAYTKAGDPAHAKEAAERAVTLIAGLGAAWKADFERYSRRKDLLALRQEIAK